jgi:hypothetical protein
MFPSVAPEVEEQIIVRERLRWLAIGYYVKGTVGAVFISFLLLHFCMLLGLSFIPESSWNQRNRTPNTARSPAAVPSPPPQPTNDAPPVILFRILAAVIGVIILLGWTFGGLTIYAGRCIQQRKHRMLIIVMGGLNCILIPWGTLLGIATFMVLQSPAGLEEFRSPRDEMAPAAM